MGFLPGDGGQQAPVNLAGVFFKQRLHLRKNIFHRAQEGAGIDIIEIVAVAEVFLLEARQGAVFIDVVEEIKHCRRQRIIVVPGAKPGDRLFVGDIEGHRQLRMDALKQADGHRVGDGVIKFTVNHRLHQRRGTAFFVHAPGKIRVFLGF